MVFAVACVDRLMIYDTQQTLPIGFVSDIHYSSMTDLAWCVSDYTSPLPSSHGRLVRCLTGLMTEECWLSHQPMVTAPC